METVQSSHSSRERRMQPSHAPHAGHAWLQCGSDQPPPGRNQCIRPPRYPRAAKQTRHGVQPRWLTPRFQESRRTPSSRGSRSAASPIAPVDIAQVLRCAVPSVSEMTTASPIAAINFSKSMFAWITPPTVGNAAVSIKSRRSIGRRPYASRQTQLPALYTAPISRMWKICSLL
jgi:hypothetical protein